MVFNRKSNKSFSKEKERRIRRREEEKAINKKLNAIDSKLIKLKQRREEILNHFFIKPTLVSPCLSKELKMIEQNIEELEADWVKIIE